MATLGTKSRHTYAFLLIILAGCGSGREQRTEALDIAVCDPTAGPFSLEIDNTYLPLAVGQVSVLEGADDDAFVRLEITVLDETEIVAGVTTRVVQEREFEDGELTGLTHSFIAQAPDGTVCFFGEDVDEFEDGELIGHEGQWRAGEGENLPGIIMPGDPEVGQTYTEAFAPGIVEDVTEIKSIGGRVTVPAGTFDDVLRSVIVDEEERSYAPGVGLILDDSVIALISFTPGQN